MAGLIDYIVGFIGVSEEELTRYIDRAPKLYRKYDIPKKKKGEFRTIFHPAKTTKAIQLATVNLLSCEGLVHECAAAFVPGVKSPLLKNARKHSGFKFTIRVDVKDFFPSIIDADFESLYRSRAHVFKVRLTEGEIEICKKIFFVHQNLRPRFLAIGAPSSPFLSNLIMFHMDEEFSSYAENLGGCYTRYADDLTFSSDRIDYCESFVDQVREVFRKHPYPRLVVKEAKTYLSSRSSRRIVTGLVITPGGEVKVPRKLKRYIRKQCFDFQQGFMPPQDIPRLKGYLAYLSDVEPAYLNNLAIKYNSGCIRSIYESGAVEAKRAIE